MFNKNARQCTARSKRTGERCKCVAVTGYNVCRVHGCNKKNPGGSKKGERRTVKTGMNSEIVKKYKEKAAESPPEGESPEEVEAMKEKKQDLIGDQPDLNHGFLASELLDDIEMKTFKRILGRMYKDFTFNKSSDFYAVELVALNLMLYRRAARDMNMKAVEAFDRTIRLHLKDLKATKITREGETVNVKTTPAEWAAALVEHVREEERVARKSAYDRERYREQKEERAADAGENREEGEKKVRVDSVGPVKNSDKTKNRES